MDAERVVGKRVTRLLRQLRNRTVRSEREFQDLSTKEVFDKIYHERRWGVSADSEHIFSSGPGSHDPSQVDPYVQAVREFLLGLPRRPTVVDLGCGDFNIGSQLVTAARHYTACDIVEALIEYNTEFYDSLEHLEFRTVDITRDPIPNSEVVVVRQVLQHLSNERVAQFCRRIPTECQHLIVTEHLPDFENFKPNKDKPTGEWTRVRLDSGLVLTEAPFNLRVKSEQVLCETQDFRGVGRTIAYAI